MKKMCACAAAALLLLAGCKEKETPAPEVQVQAEEAPREEAEPQPALIGSVMIAGGYWRLVAGDGEEKMKWVEYAVPGTTVQAYGEAGSSAEDARPEMKRQVVRTTDNQKRDFVHILFEGHDYWAQDYSIVVDAAPGVVMGGGAYVFSRPSPDAMGDRKLDIGTVVGVLNGSPDPSAGPYAANYVQVNAYVQSRLLEGVYLAKESVSLLARDMLAMQIYEKLSARGADGGFSLTDAVARDELFGTALSFTLPAAVQDMFLELYGADHPGEYPEEWQF